MRTPGGDRRGPAVPSVCAALILLAALFCPALALDADYFVAENGSVFHAEISIQETGSYEFTEPGLLGESVSVEVTNITLVDESGENAVFEEQWTSISFDEGNYTVGFDQEFGDRNFKVIMDAAYNITLTLPGNFHVGNPLLGLVSGDGLVKEGENITTISWTKKSYAEARFYDDFQEKMLFAFGSFWLVLVIIFLIPYLISRRKSD